MKTREQLAKDYCSTHLTASSLGSFLAGFEACEKSLIESSDEFDDHVAETEANYTQGSWLNDKGIAFVAGARWQHSQDQLKIQALKEKLNAAGAMIKNEDEISKLQSNRIKELESEIQRLKDKYEKNN